MSAKTARNRTGSGKLMVKLKGKIVTKILNRKGNNEVTDYGAGEMGDGGHHITCHHDQCVSASQRVSRWRLR